MKVVLTIAGSDSGGGAGVQADLKTIAAHGLHGASALTAITVQDSVSVLEWAPLPGRLVAAQIAAVAADMTVAAVKTGMLGSLEVIEAVAGALERLRLPGLVVDPVLAASAGPALAAAGAERAYLERVVPLAAVLTPNLAEAGALLGRPVRSLDQMREAARELVGRGARAVVVKGGHLEGDPVDVFCDGERVVEIGGPRVPGGGAHGTGCVFSATLACGLALGDEPLAAARRARAEVVEALRAAYAVGSGARVLDPLWRKAAGARC